MEIVQLENLGVSGTIIVTWVSVEIERGVWIGFVWLIIGISGGI
jgi:hypothetical protein